MPHIYEHILSGNAIRFRIYLPSAYRAGPLVSIRKIKIYIYIFDKNPYLPSKSGPGAASCCIIKYTSMCNEKLGKVTSFGGPSLKIESAVLGKPPGEFWGEGEGFVCFVGWKPFRPVRTIAGLRDIG